jgi:site-specific recombinase XerD
MFQQLFERPHALRRQLTSPLLEERQRYLTHCADQGKARQTLREIALYQLITIDYLKLADEGLITCAEIEMAANRWTQRLPQSSSRKDTASPLSKARFIKHATHWLDFLGRLQPPPAPARPFAEYSTAFADFMRGECGLAEATIQYRCREIELFLAEVCGQPRALPQLTITQIDAALLDKIKQAGYARRTIQTLASALRAFFRYAEQRGWCPHGLAYAIKAPRVFRHETLPFSPVWADVQRLLASTQGSSPVALRDRAILLLLAVYGLRSGEVRRLQLADLDWEHELLHLKRVKQGPPQQLPLTQTVGEAMLRYLKDARPRTPCRELFLTLRAPFRPLSSGAIFQLVKRRWQPLGVTLAHHGPHSLRHACATRLINQGVALKEISDQLGHRDLETTRIYAKVDLTRLREVADFNLGGLLCN